VGQEAAAVRVLWWVMLSLCLGQAPTSTVVGSRLGGPAGGPCITDHPQHNRHARTLCCCRACAQALPRVMSAANRTRCCVQYNTQQRTTPPYLHSCAVFPERVQPGVESWTEVLCTCQRSKPEGVGIYQHHARINTSPIGELNTCTAAAEAAPPPSPSPSPSPSPAAAVS
jgi:hypothetical protein